jgi:hypothetical protein
MCRMFRSRTARHRIIRCRIARSRVVRSRVVRGGLLFAEWSPEESSGAELSSQAGLSGSLGQVQYGQVHDGHMQKGQVQRMVRLVISGIASAEWSGE